MNNQTLCRICKAEGVRLHCITNTYLQEIYYEHDTGISLPTEDYKPLLACITCCDRLQHCYQVRNSCEQREKFLTMMVSDDEHSNTNMAAISPEYNNNTCVVQSQCQQSSAVDVKQECTTIVVGDETCQQKEVFLEKENAEIGPLPRIVNVKSEKNIINEMRPYEIKTSFKHVPHEVQYMERVNIKRSSEEEHSVNKPSPYTPLMKTLTIMLERCDYMINDGVKSNEEQDLEYNDIIQWSDTEVDTLNTHKSSHDIPLKTLKIVLQRCDSRNGKRAPKRVTQSNTSEDTACHEITVGKVVTRSQYKKSHKHRHIICVSGRTKYECNLCNKYYTSKQSLSRHFLLHTGEKPYKCNICNKCFGRKECLMAHNRTHTRDKPHKCNICYKCFTEKRTLVIHNRIHTGERRFKCNICRKKFIQKAHLNTHIRIHTGEKPYKCNTCYKSFGQQRNLLLHNRIHTGEKPYKCNVCNRCFSVKCSLVVHYRLHTNEKPYKCNTCNKCFTSSSALVTHIRIHTGDRPYKCNSCSKCYTTKGALDTHSLIHTGDKTFNCKYCSKCFFIKRSLDIHNRIHTGEKPYKCPSCSKCFYIKGNLDRHLKKRLKCNHNG